MFQAASVLCCGKAMQCDNLWSFGKVYLLYREYGCSELFNKQRIKFQTNANYLAYKNTKLVLALGCWKWRKSCSRQTARLKPKSYFIMGQVI